jgi:hypothetical protein
MSDTTADSNESDDDSSGIEQPTNNTLSGQVARLPGVRSIPVVGAGNPQHAEDHIPLQDAVRGEYAIRRDDGAYFGLIEVEPANMATVDDDEWEEQVERLSSVLMANTNGCVQIYSPMRSVDYGDRHETYREQSQEHQLTNDAAGSDVLADIADERAKNVNLYEQTTLSRTHYVGVSVSELDTTAQFTEDRGGLATVPVLGSMKKKREASAQKDDDAHARAMCDKLTQRVDRMAKAIRGMEGVKATALSSTRATQVIADHYGREDAFAYDDYASLVRQAPLVYGEDDDPEYPISHEHSALDSPGGRAATDGGAAAQQGYQDGVSPQSRTVADVVHNDPDALSNHYRSLIAAKFDTSDPGYVRIDNRTLASTIAVRNWPRVPTYGMFSNLLASSKPGVELILSVQAEADESDDMDTKVLSLEQKWQKAEEKGSFTKDRDRQKYETAKDINETRKAPNKAMFEVSAYITIKSDITSAPDDRDPVDWHNDTVSSAKRRLQEKPANAGGVRVDHNQMNGLHSSAPIAKDVIGETALMKDMGLASVYPWHAKNLTDPNGVVVGQHRERDEPTVLDIYNRPTGYNIAVFGTLGSGKTTTVKELISRHKLRNPETTVAVIDPLRDFHGLTKVFDGDRVVIGGNTPINPFHIEPTPDDVLEEIGREIPFKTASRQAKSFIETYYQMEGLNYETRKGTWEKAIKLAYEWAGITEDPDTHDRPSPTVMTAIWFIRDMANNPGNYVDEALDDNERAKKDRENTAVTILNNDIEPFLDGGEYHNLTKPTELEIEDGGFLYLDLKEYENDHETGGLMMQLLISQIYELTKNSPNPTVTAFDEARYMFSNTADLGFLRQIVRHSRHYNLSMLYSTQQMGDFFEKREDKDKEVIAESAKDILDNTSMKIFHYMKEMNDDWAEAFDLTDAQQTYIKDAEPGERHVGYSEALLQVDREGSFPLRVEMDEDVNPREFAAYRYDPQEHGEDMAAYLRHHDDVCNWRWTRNSGFRAEPRAETGQVDTTPARSEEAGEGDAEASRPSNSNEAETAEDSETEPEPDKESTIKSADEVIEVTSTDEQSDGFTTRVKQSFAGAKGTDTETDAAADAETDSDEGASEQESDESGTDKPTVEAEFVPGEADADPDSDTDTDTNETDDSAGLSDRMKDRLGSVFAHSAAGKSQPDLTDIGGVVDERKAAALRNAGFETVTAVYTADEDALAEVQTIDGTQAGYIQRGAEQALDASDAPLPEKPAESETDAEDEDGPEADESTGHPAEDPQPPESSSDAERSDADDTAAESNGDEPPQPALTDIREVGDDRADDLRAEGYESVADVATADQTTLTEVEGIGEARVETISASAADLLDGQPDDGIAADGRGGE